MVREAPPERSGAGPALAGGGWFVLNVRDARWLGGGTFGMYTPKRTRPLVNEKALSRLR